jgi:hypothetical protein
MFEKMMHDRHKPSLLTNPVTRLPYGQKPKPETPHLVNGIIGSIPQNSRVTTATKANKVIDKQFNK